MMTSYGKFNRIQRLMEVRNNKDTTGHTDADRLVNASLVKEAFFAIRFMFIGMLVLFLGLSFFWLFCNSWHITETDWVGGLPALIHALTVMEICLLPLLFYMYKDGRETLAKANRMEKLAQKMLKEKRLTTHDVNLSSLEELTGWLPFWDTGIWPFQTVDDSTREVKGITDEVSHVEDELERLVGITNDDDDDGSAKTKTNKTDDNKRKEHVEEKAKELLAQVRATRMEGYREFFYLVVNAIAFYGYLVGIIVYYWDDEVSQPVWIKRLLLNMTNSDADWHGNFAGDLMWTIEPAVILTSPLFINVMRPKSGAAAEKAKTE